MSPNEVEITQRMPKSSSAQGACSRLEPQAKLSPAPSHFCVRVGRLVEDEVGVLAAVILVALLGEKSLAKAGTLDGLEVLLGDYHVGVDIDELQGRRDAFQRSELFHRQASG